MNARRGASRGADLVYLLAAYALTLPAFFVAELVAPSADLVAALKLICMAVFAWHAFAVMRGRRENPSMAALAAATGLIWTAVIVIYLYKVVTMMPLDFAMILLSLGDAGRTLEHVLGRHGVLIAGATLAALIVASSGIARLLFGGLRRCTHRWRPWQPLSLACVATLAYFASGDLWYSTGELLLYPRSYSSEAWFKIAPPFVPDYSALPVRSGESVFILQLESVNSYAVFERAADGKSYRPRVPQPGLETVLKEGHGVLFPRFWSNGAQTNRAWESILCAVSGNLGPPIAADTARLQGRKCLPAHLADEGYATVFLYSYFHGGFFNLAGFAPASGFQDLVYGSKLMHEGDRRHHWGYDDCVFYERAFDYLTTHGLARRQRLFAYFEVGTNHTPFFNTMKYPEAHPFSHPHAFIEHYLNSVAEQDHCLRTFWKRFEALGRDDIHLFIVPDHSLWVSGTLDNEDAPFATWLAYVPPKRRAGQFASRTVLSPVPSQAQLYPTVLELLGADRSRRSFAFALRGEETPRDYDDCKLLSEPHQRLIVRRGSERAEFRFGVKPLFLSEAGASTADFWAFHDRYACK